VNGSIETTRKRSRASILSLGDASNARYRVYYSEFPLVGPSVTDLSSVIRRDEWSQGGPLDGQIG
jgi:hypothetical protein